MAQILIGHFAFSQNKEQDIIRQLEEEERVAILKSDTVKLSVLMSHDIVVQNPDNIIVSYRQIMERIKAGKINYSSFERIIEKITFTANISIVMGKEIIKAEGQTTNAGKLITRRFTNIWMKDISSWKLVARQASIVSVE